MKIIRKTIRGEKTRVVTLRLPESIMKNIDRLVEREGISRQGLISAILQVALKDQKLEIEI